MHIHNYLPFRYIDPLPLYHRDSKGQIKIEDNGTDNRIMQEHFKKEHILFPKWKCRTIEKKEKFMHNKFIVNRYKGIMTFRSILKPRS